MTVVTYSVIIFIVYVFRPMIQTFGSEETELLFRHDHSKHFEKFERIALRKLEMIHAAVSVIDLKVPPGNRLEKLKGKRAEYFSIRINDRWRVCFMWRDGNAYNVQIEDYH